MASRLRSMFLIDARTSAQASGTINVIDPRDGVAVTGDNAAGKSTTLQILPLFFGNIASDISVSGGSRLPMLQYVLVNSTSAFVFEYQRGASNDDINCVVLRRGERSNSAAYRFFKGPYRREFFATVRADGQEELSDDAAFVDLATRNGVMPSQIFSSAQYRSIILGVASTTLVEPKLKAMGREFSYAERALPNLDRLVNAVVKEKVDFRDFLGVAVSIIQSRLGKRQTTGTAVPNRITLNQNSRQVSLWLNNVDACKQVERMEPIRLALEGCLAQTAPLSRTHSQLAANLQKLRLDRNNQIKKNELEFEQFVSERADALTVEQLQTKGFAFAAGIARTSHLAAQRDWQDDSDRLDHFVQKQAEAGVFAVASIPTLQNDRVNVQNQIDLASGEASKLATECTNFVNAAHQARNTEKDALQSQIDHHNRDTATERVGINDAETAARQAAQREAAEPVRLNKVLQDDMLGKVAVARERVKSPAIPKDIALAVEVSASAHLAATQKLAQAKAAEEVARSAQREASEHYNACEGQLNRAEQAKSDALLQEAAAQALLAPKEGSVLAALRASANTAWMDDLARIIRPELLAATDLNPRFLAAPGQLSNPEETATPLAADAHSGTDQSNTAYGWSFSTDQIDRPDWIDAAELRSNLEVWQAKVKVAADQINTCRLATQASGARRSLLVQQTAMAAADSTTAAAKEQSAKLANEQSRNTRDAAAKAAVKLANEEVSRLGTEQRELIEKGKQLVRSLALAEKAIAEHARKRREDADARHQISLNALDSLLKGCDTRFTAHEAKLLAQRDQAMTEAGVSVGTLNALNASIRVIAARLLDLHALVPIVNSWNAWLVNGGRMHLAALHQALDTAKDADTAAQGASQAHDETVRTSAVAYEMRIAALKANSDTATAELQTLETVAVVLQGDISNISNITLASPSDDLSDSSADLLLAARRYAVDLADNTAAMEAHFLALKKALTSDSSAVSEYITNHMAKTAGALLADRAEQLKLVIGLAGKTVLSTVNQEFSTIMAGIMMFEKDVRDFDLAVRRFNSDLQAGMKQVSQFASVQNFDVRITTNLETVGFWTDLTALRSSQMGKNSSASSRPDTILDDDAVTAMRKVLSMLEKDNRLEFDMFQHITLAGSAVVNGQLRTFGRESELALMSSNGLNMIILVTLLAGMLNTMRGLESIYVPWVTDEIGRLDAPNFLSMVKMLKDNHIDVITASPLLNIAQLRHFARRYRVESNGTVALFVTRAKVSHKALAAPSARDFAVEA